METFVLVISGIIFNLLFCLAIFLTQERAAKLKKIPARHSCIKSEEPLLYCQDMAVFLVGDLIGLSLINGALFYYFSDNLSIRLALLWALIIMLDGFLLYFQLSLPSHRPDAGSPGKGKLSLTGWIHLFYHGYFAGGVILFVFVSMYSFELFPIAMFVAGGLVWLSAGLVDLKGGVFNSGKQKSSPGDAREATDFT